MGKGKGCTSLVAKYDPWSGGKVEGETSTTELPSDLHMGTVAQHALYTSHIHHTCALRPELEGNALHSVTQHLGG